MNYVDGYTKAPGTIDYHYPELANRLYTVAYNDRLTKIITQKFIANTPWLPLEAWSDHRRLGLPFFNTPVIEKSIALMPQLTQSNYKVAQVNFFPQRIPYPSSIKNGNPQGYNGAVQKLGGKDEVFTPLWWAKKK
ncbi:SusD/RagB family nutrient-binding outer membrane lipoprotein [Porphyromonas macacae]|nr:SusD/RagB family nutrient-binding outer membrane lipoprotein [Porphyromonas macacae]